VTDHDRKFVLAVATPQDLEVRPVLFTFAVHEVNFVPEFCDPSGVLMYNLFDLTLEIVFLACIIMHFRGLTVRRR